VSEQEAGNVGVTIPFDAGFAAPKIWFKGDAVDEVKADVIKSFGFPENWADRSLDEVVIEASRWARGLYTAANELSAEPKVTVWTLDGAKAGGEPAEKSEPKAQPKKRAASGGLAAQAKAAKEEVTEPRQVTNSIESLIANAMSTDALNDIYEETKPWTEEQMAMGKARAEELANG
jgi:hypothetical protein